MQVTFLTIGAQLSPAAAPLLAQMQSVVRNATAIKTNFQVRPPPSPRVHVPGGSSEARSRAGSPPWISVRMQAAASSGRRMPAR